MLLKYKRPCQMKLKIKKGKTKTQLSFPIRRHKKREHDLLMLQRNVFVVRRKSFRQAHNYFFVFAFKPSQIFSWKNKELCLILKTTWVNPRRFLEKLKNPEIKCAFSSNGLNFSLYFFSLSLNNFYFQKYLCCLFVILLFSASSFFLL